MTELVFHYTDRPVTEEEVDAHEAEQESIALLHLAQQLQAQENDEPNGRD